VRRYRSDGESFASGVCEGEIHVHSVRTHDQTLNLLLHAIEVLPGKTTPRNIASQDTSRGGQWRKSAFSFRRQSPDNLRRKILRGGGYFKEGEMLAEAGVEWTYDRSESSGILRGNGGRED